MSDEMNELPLPLGEGRGEGAAKPHGQFLVYPVENGRIKIEVRLEHETVWLTQQHMAELFQKSVPNISMHLRNIFADGELQESATVKEFLIVPCPADRPNRSGWQRFRQSHPATPAATQAEEEGRQEVTGSVRGVCGVGVSEVKAIETHSIFLCEQGTLAHFKISQCASRFVEQFYV